MSRYILLLGFQSTAFSISPGQGSHFVWIYTQLLICCFSSISLCDLFCSGVMTFKTSRPADTHSITPSTLGKAFWTIFHQFPSSSEALHAWFCSCLDLSWVSLSLFWILTKDCWEAVKTVSTAFTSRMEYIQGEALPPGVCDTGSILVIWNMHNIYKGCTCTLKTLQRSCPKSTRVGRGCSTHCSQEGLEAPSCSWHLSLRHFILTHRDREGKMGSLWHFLSFPVSILQFEFLHH